MKQKISAAVAQAQAAIDRLGERLDDADYITYMEDLESFCRSAIDAKREELDDTDGNGAEVEDEL